MKNRRIGFGSAIFLALIITLAAGCNPGLGQDGPLVDENGNYIITIHTSGGEGRASIDPTQASLYAKEYEIVCRDTASPNAYFSGYANAGKPLTVSLPAGTYNMLLLAGDGNKVLLGTGWNGGETIGPDTGSVAITVDPLTILEADMKFNDGSGEASLGVSASPLPVGLPIFQVDTSTSTGLTTKFKVKNIKNLENAGVAGTFYTAGFKALEVVLEYVDSAHKGIPNKSFVEAGLGTATPSDPDVTLLFDPLTYTTDAADPNWDALVYLNVQYIPFSQAAPPAKSNVWYIRNGLGRTVHDGAVWVIAGTGGGYDITISH